MDFLGVEVEERDQLVVVLELVDICEMLARWGTCHIQIAILIHIVRDAFVGSLTNTFASGPPLSLYVSHVSTVPKARVPLSYAFFTASTFFNSQSSFVDEGYVDNGRPQSSISSSAPFFAFSSRTIEAARVSVHT